MNKHEIVFNMINDECYFTSNHCEHVEIFSLLNRSIISQKLFNSINTLYLSSSKRSLTSHFSMSVQKYQIFQRRLHSTFSRIISSRSTVENSNEEEQSMREFLNTDSRYVIEEINKKYSSKKLFKEERKMKIIREAQESNLINVSMRKSNIIKKFTRRSSKRFKVVVFENENDEQNLDFDASLNIAFIDATAFQSLANFKDKKKKLRLSF